MPATLLAGRQIADAVRDRIRATLAQRPGLPPPCLAAVLIGADSGSRMYAQSQARAASELGIEHRTVELPPDTPQWQVEATIAAMNADTGVHGILLFQPAPKGIDLLRLQAAIAVQKDVEGVSPANFGRLALGRPALPPCTAAGAIECIKSTGMAIAGKRAVVVGRSPIVGRPAALMLLALDATVTICHSKSQDLPAICREAEILVVAVGQPQMIGRECIRPGAIVIDVGTHRIAQGDGQPAKTVGDVRTDEAAALAAIVTPVPGGVGPVTVAMLLENVVTAATGALCC